MISWDTCRDHFEPDGGLRDIFVRSTTIEDWRLHYQSLRATYPLEYFVDGQPQQPPATVDEALAARSTASPMLRFRVGGITIVCHFFTPDEIEMDLDPCEVSSPAAFDSLLTFLQFTGDKLGKSVTLCYEGDDEHPFITYQPSSGSFHGQAG
jgi:hypothetical protein